MTYEEKTGCSIPIKQFKRAEVREQQMLYRLFEGDGYHISDISTLASIIDIDKEVDQEIEDLIDRDRKEIKDNRIEPLGYFNGL